MIALLAGCGGGGGSASDTDAVAQTLKSATSALASGDGGKACGYLTPDAQRQAQLQAGIAALGTTDCPTMVNRATAFMSPLDRKQIESLEPSNIAVNGDSASATVATQVGGSPMSVDLNLQKVDGDWKISGFRNEVGLPGS